MVSRSRLNVLFIATLPVLVKIQKEVSGVLEIINSWGQQRNCLSRSVLFGTAVLSRPIAVCVLVSRKQARNFNLPKIPIPLLTTGLLYYVSSSSSSLPPLRPLSHPWRWGPIPSFSHLRLYYNIVVSRTIGHLILWQGVQHCTTNIVFIGADCDSVGIFKAFCIHLIGCPTIPVLIRPKFWWWGLWR